MTDKKASASARTSNDKGQCGGPSLRSRMTAKNKQRQKQRQRQKQKQRGLLSKTRRQLQVQQGQISGDGWSLSVAVVLSLRRCGDCGDSAVGGEEEGFGAAAVGAEGLDLCGFEAAQDLGARVAEGVVTAYADECVVGADGGEEGRVGGGAAAVVADFEKGGGGNAAVLEHGGFAAGFCVAFEQNAGVVEVEAHDERVVVYGRAGVGVGEFGGEDGGLETGPGEGFAGVEIADGDVLLFGLGEEGAEEGGVAGVNAEPEFAGVEVAEDGGHASHVVGVRVGEEDYIETTDVAGPQVGGNDFFADVPGAGGCVGAATGGASGVDENGLAGGANDEQRVALTDVDGSDFELAGVGEGRRGIEDGEGDEDGGEDCCGEDETAASAQSDDAEDDAGAGERDGEGCGAGGAEVGEGVVLDAVDGEAHEVQQKGGEGGGENRDPDTEQRREEHEDGDAEQD